MLAYSGFTSWYLLVCCLCLLLLNIAVFTLVKKLMVTVAWSIHGFSVVIKVASALCGLLTYSISLISFYIFSFGLFFVHHFDFSKCLTQDHVNNWRKTALVLTSVFFLAAGIWFVGEQKCLLVITSMSWLSICILTFHVWVSRCLIYNWF